MPKQYKVFSVEGGTQQTPKKKWGWVLFDEADEPVAQSATYYGSKTEAKAGTEKNKNNADAPIT
jgi:hypothetical protein